MTDLVSRLRSAGPGGDVTYLMKEAAAEIDRLNAANEELIRGMTEMAERFTAAMDKANLSLQPVT